MYSCKALLAFECSFSSISHLIYVLAACPLKVQFYSTLSWFILTLFSTMMHLFKSLNLWPLAFSSYLICLTLLNSEFILIKNLLFDTFNSASFLIHSMSSFYIVLQAFESAALWIINLCLVLWNHASLRILLHSKFLYTFYLEEIHAKVVTNRIVAKSHSNSNHTQKVEYLWYSFWSFLFK